MLTLQRGGDFSLELWRFHESWRVPLEGEQDDRDTQLVDGVSTSFRAPGQQRASILDREETRVSYAGRFSATEVPLLRFSGFRKHSLNQGFVEEPSLRIDGISTWWSEDGRYFLYYASDYGRWKFNAVRTARGDGFCAVAAGEKRAGHGFAHSGLLPDSSRASLGAYPDDAGAAAALTIAEGWFEIDDGEWVPVEPHVERGVTQRFSFSAKGVSAEEVLTSGEDTSRSTYNGSALTFGGVRLATGAARGSVLLTLPPPPPILLDDEEEDAFSAGAVGEPEVLLLQADKQGRSRL